MIPRTQLALLFIGFLVGAMCQPTPPLDYQETAEEAGEEGEKQVVAGATSLLSLASLIPQLLTPLLTNISTGLTNALTATVMGRAIAFIPPDTATPPRQLPPAVGS